MNANRLKPALDGSQDIARAAAVLAEHLPAELTPLAALAYNYWWSWAPGGSELFRDIDATRWEDCGENPVRLLQETPPYRLMRLAADPAFLARVRDLAGGLAGLVDGPRMALHGREGPAAYLCAEYAIHSTLPTYAGGLGVLAGDFLKEASDQAQPLVAVGLFYSQGSFHQQLDVSGWQQEYWTATDMDRSPCALVTATDGGPLVVEVPLRGANVRAQVWRVDVGGVPLYLLDTNRRDNSPADRWITSRLYDGDRETRLAQYAVLGLGGMRALEAMGIRPAIVHLNEGHAALAVLEMIAQHRSLGLVFADAVAAVRRRVVFVTHTPVAAGNETYAAGELAAALGDVEAGLGATPGWLLRTGRVHPEAAEEPFGLTPFALRMAGQTHAVSRRHGEVAREMWREVRRESEAAPVAITHITNGVHLPTWMSGPMRELLDRRLEAGWDRAGAPADAWQGVWEIPAAELWEVRCRLRAEFVAFAREQSVWNRLGRGHGRAYAELAAHRWDAATLTVGFARRIATYKRLSLLSSDPVRGVRLVGGPQPLQLVIAGKAHPRDEEAKRSVQAIFALDGIPEVAGRVVFLSDYDLSLSARCVRGCDLWVNLPRPPFEACGTSGMKSALNGGLQLSVLDGWWAEAYDGANGWAMAAPVGLDAAEQDRRDGVAFFDLLEREVIPAFYERDSRGIPQKWVERMKASLEAVGREFTAGRMVRDYIARAAAAGETG